MKRLQEIEKNESVRYGCTDGRTEGQTDVKYSYLDRDCYKKKIVQVPKYVTNETPQSWPHFYEKLSK